MTKPKSPLLGKKTFKKSNCSRNHSVHDNCGSSCLSLSSICTRGENANRFQLMCSYLCALHVKKSFGFKTHREQSNVINHRVPLRNSPSITFPVIFVSAPSKKRIYRSPILSKGACEEMIFSRKMTQVS